MKIIIIEDELPAARRLRRMVLELFPNAHILAEIDSVEDAVDWLNNEEKADLLLMDIQLADGLSFEIFEQCTVETPVIFTTAFDEYTLKAFKTNSIDYLLKPVNSGELKTAIDKFQKLQMPSNPSLGMIQKVWESLQKPNYKERFMVKSGQQFTFVKTEDIVWIASEDGLLFITNKEGKKFFIEGTLEKVLEQLNPKAFFQISRNRIVQIDAIQKVIPISNSRLKLEMLVKDNEDIYISRARVGAFKEWIQ